MGVRTSELTKYAANSMLATKINLMNELAIVAEKVGGDIEKVRLVICSDLWIGYRGSYVPKDVHALIRSAHAFGHQSRLLEAPEGVNHRQKHAPVRKIRRYLKNELRRRTFALRGLGFKPNDFAVFIVRLYDESARDLASRGGKRVARDD
jgi:UDPglucose 6-dehydrogenase